MVTWNKTLSHTIDAVSQVPELLGVVQHFNTLGVGVVAHCERPGDGGRKFPVGPRDVNVVGFLCNLNVLCIYAEKLQTGCV